ncbi:MAG: hypothetical protein MK135_15700, partial [Polyangiaceae bacterium]|nr:hypothetical protein [Polyangiaceae bacterium]
MKAPFIVARFELTELFRSKLVVLTCLLFACGAALGTTIFLAIIKNIEEQALQLIAQQSQIPVDQVPMAELKEQALDQLAEAMPVAEWGEALLRYDPLALFFAFIALHSVALIVIGFSAGATSAQLQSGEARFALTRISRADWIKGKAFGQSLVLALCLFFGMSGTLLTAYLRQYTINFELIQAMFLAAAGVWLYGICWIGIFSAVSLLTRSPFRAKLLSLAALLTITSLYYYLSQQQEAGVNSFAAFL